MTIIDQIEVNEQDGFISVRFKKSNGGYHRCVFPVDVDMDMQIKAVNDHLQAMGHNIIDDTQEKQILRKGHNQLKNKLGKKKEQYY